MELVVWFFDISSTLFQIWGYQVSYLEFVGTLLYFGSVVLIAKKNIWTWPVGIASVILYMILFYQFQLYSDALEQIYYLVVSFFGWWYWNRRKLQDESKSMFSTGGKLFWPAAISILAGITLGSFMSEIHIHLPAMFPEPASMPYLDAVTTTLSLTAMWLLSVRRAESWVYWIIVDILAIYIYFSKGILFIGVQYVALLAIAIYGLFNWARIVKGQTPIS
jgi:nicotinamide mononucleotide transporter